MIKLSLTAVDEVRRRVQQDTTRHRGRAGDPLYRSECLTGLENGAVDALTTVGKTFSEENYGVGLEKGNTELREQAQRRDREDCSATAPGFTQSSWPPRSG